MRIVFCGTPDYAVPSLKRLCALSPRHEVVGVVSQPDKPKGRGNSKTPTPPPVVDAARALGIPNERIFQPRSINTSVILESLRSLQPDILCVVAYGNILKQEALSLGRFFPINAHASLLPKYRGAAPIQAALLAGDAETGVCIIKMEAGLDTGPVFLRRAIPIAPRETAGTLHDKLAELSAECFADALELLDQNKFTLEPQNDALASYAAKLEKSSGQIDWSNNAVSIERLVRAMTPWPGAWTRVSSPDRKFSQRIRIAEADLAADGATHPPTQAQELTAVCGDGGVLAITRIQPEGKREMSVAEFLRGAGKALLAGAGWG